MEGSDGGGRSFSERMAGPAPRGFWDDRGARKMRTRVTQTYNSCRPQRERGEVADPNDVAAWYATPCGEFRRAPVGGKRGEGLCSRRSLGAEKSAAAHQGWAWRTHKVTDIKSRHRLRPR